MIWLVSGVVLWFFIHGLKALFPTARKQLAAKLGDERSKGPVALGILLSLVLIVIGWRQMGPAELLYVPPTGLRALTGLLMVVAVYLLVTSVANLRYRRWVRHPQLSALLIWSLAHLASNGELRSVILFTGMALWSVAVMIGINRRDGQAEPVKPDSLTQEVKYLLITLAAVALLVLLHGFYTGIALVAF